MSEANSKYNKKANNIINKIEWNNNRSTVTIAVKVLSALVLSLVMFIFIKITAESVGVEASEVNFAAVSFSLIYFIGLLLIAFYKKLNPLSQLILAAGFAAAIVMRVSLLYYVSGDYIYYLSGWIQKMKELPGLLALKTPIGNYNMPYMYILFAIAKLNLPDLLAIKVFSCIFDVFLAYFVMKLISLKTENPIWLMLSFIFTLILPTVFLNSAYWAQCDGIFTAFCVASFYFALREKGGLSMSMFALAFSFKLQAIFIIPLLAVCFFTKKIKPKSIIMFPVVFLLTSVPALLAGRSAVDTFNIYFTQVDFYSSLTLNAPSIWTLAGGANADSFNLLAIMLCGCVVLVFLYLMWYYRKAIGTVELIYIAYISSALMPFLLPRMHDRYFFVADIFALVLFLYDTKKWYVPLVTVLASYNSYYYFVISGTYLFDIKYATVALLAVIVLVCVSLKKRLGENQRINLDNSSRFEEFTKIR